MKDFFRRLKFYGIGFGIGIVFVVFFFQNRGCTWFPSNRVKNTLLGRVLVVEENTLASLKSKGMTNSDLVQFLNEGDVDFGASKKAGNPQVYKLNLEVKGVDRELWFALPKNSFVAEILVPSGSIQKATTSTKGKGEMIHFPNVANIVYLDTNKRLTCQQEKTGLIAPMQVMKLLKQSGKINFEKSHLKVSPLAEQFIEFKHQTAGIIGSNTTWYQEHIRISNFETEKDLECQ